MRRDCPGGASNEGCRPVLQRWREKYVAESPNTQVEDSEVKVVRNQVGHEEKAAALYKSSTLEGKKLQVVSSNGMCQLASPLPKDPDRANRSAYAGRHGQEFSAQPGSKRSKLLREADGRVCSISKLPEVCENVPWRKAYAPQLPK